VSARRFTLTLTGAEVDALWSLANAGAPDACDLPAVLHTPAERGAGRRAMRKLTAVLQEASRLPDLKSRPS
jgi:hypothetical protein